MEEVKREVIGEVLFPNIVDSAFDVAHVHEIKEEFSFTELNPHGELVDCAVGSLCTGTHCKFKMEEVVNREITTSEFSLTAITDFKPAVSHIEKIKTEFSVSEPYSHDELPGHAVVKHEDTSIQSLDLQLKSEVSDLRSGNDDIYIKLEPLVGEELHIKNEVEESLAGQTINACIADEHCYSSLRNKLHLNNHNIWHIKTHTGETPFQCKVCGYKSIQRSMLQQHMKTHTEEKCFQCSVCDYKCIQKNVLQQHLKTHIEAKPFKCIVCNYSCIWKCNLQVHMKTHTGEKPFKCNVCDYKCMRNSRLQQHLKTHREEKPFQCNICNSKFKVKISLQKHIKTHIGEKSF